MHTSHRGFTLIETLIVVVILVLVSGGVITMYINYDSIYRRENAGVDVVRSASRIATRVSLATAQASSVSIAHTFSGVTHTSSSTVLVLELPSTNASGDVIANQYDFIAFYASGTRAYQLTEAAAGSVRSSGTMELSSTLESLTFTYDSGTPWLSTSVDVDVVTSATVRDETKRTHVHRQTFLRNK